MTGIIQRVLLDLEKMTENQIDEIIKQGNTNNSKKGMFQLREEHNFELGNAKLTLELDDNIAKHYLTHQAVFERLKNVALSQQGKQKENDERRSNLIENLKQDYQKLFISSVSTGSFGLGNWINFLIGGMLDNAAGYIYVKDKKDLLEMNANQVIMIKEIGNGWYIYKTT